MLITIRDVARSANVSIGTVSRVLSGDPTVQPENASRVREAAKTLNYVPLRKRNGSAVSPEPTGLNGANVVMLIMGMDKSLASLPSVAEAIHGIESAVSTAGGNFYFADVPMADRVPAVFERQRVDAVLLKGALQGQWVESITPGLSERLRRVPCVWFLGRPDGAWGDVVQADDLHAGRLAAQHLIERGHRTLAFLNPKADQVTFLRRQAGFVLHAELAGATVQKFTGAPGEWQLPLRPVHEVEAVQGLVDNLLKATPRPTAVFVPGDSVAAAVYRALHARGMTIGKDLSVISCNNEIPLLGGLYPQVTTIDIHAAAVGRRAVDQVIWRMRHRNEPELEVALRPTLIVGSSVATLK